ncbi:DUF5309 family protein [Arthrobacter sp. SLBN-53]|uniref:SU10 major capsid protein n=1 Tax=Arthrobacter sp. SLBN-53 TaxID=2768412 RepID=UPI0011548758|nr:DUF5309 family protein [Arthrobacter sp. SLBN-53]TQK29384.1 hypothetical protein FBY28_2387 [Arthrobacter sp. SLBN-53]
MGTVSGLGTTYNLPNYTGRLFTVAPSDTPLLSLIGGLGNGKRTDSTEFEWQTEDLESTSANNSRTEGAPAPTASEVSRSNVTNVVEIHQEAVEVSYTKQAATGIHNGINSSDGSNPVVDELSHQIDLKLRKIGVDIEKSFLAGVYAKPANNATARQTRGVLTAASTNVFANGGTGRAISKSILDNALAAMFGNGAPLSNDTTVLMVGPGQKVKLSDLYGQTPLNAPVQSRNIGGYSLQSIVTDFGEFGIVLNRWFPAGGIGIIDLSVLKPVFLEIPGKGVMFAEPLAKTGASEKYQLYGEVGLEYGPEQYHGWIKDLT